ncbi:MAG: TIGR00730 family Rossman fold protein [Myxococcaceae bacterium]|nr:TIGR00730 family Rossman fold protein [Myxococcaceae bacterium]
MKPERRAIAVFCGSRDGARPVFRQAAAAFGRAMADRQLDLVYGGAANGLMGAVADSVLAGGLRVIGVIPKGLDRVEFAHPRLTERIDVRTMHERKAVMADRCDAFVALPGGFGTMDELFEAITWRQLAIHSKPIGVLDVAGYYAPLVAWLDGAVAQGFAPSAVRAGLVIDADAGRLLDAVLGGG